MKEREDAKRGEAEGLTHADLVGRAARWLRRVKRCRVVVTEITTSSAVRECADALGWHAQRSFLVECKTSRADFLADRKKPFRIMPELGMGEFRYFMTPPGLVSPEELPKWWGLLEVHPDQVRVVRESIDPTRSWCAPFEPNHHEEKVVLLSVIRRTRGEYTIPTKRTTISIAPDADDARTTP